jgi:acetyl-CoA carboxylase biotin carboxyl carrier protein
VEFDLSQLRELLMILNETDIEEMSLKSENFELNVRKGSTPQIGTAIAAKAPTLDVTTAPVAAPPPTAEPPAPAPPTKNWVEVTSPMVGTFYRAPAPEEPSFVEVGDVVRRGQTLCIIEAMKLMNEIESEFNGEIMEILVGNAEPVQFGQVLMRIKSNS